MTVVMLTAFFKRCVPYKTLKSEADFRLNSHLIFAALQS